MLNFGDWVVTLNKLKLCFYFISWARVIRKIYLFGHWVSLTFLSYLD